MSSPQIYIKNMVCPRCIQAVQSILDALEMEAEVVKLGQVTLRRELSQRNRKELKHRLKEAGFELLEPGSASLISKIKTLIVEQVHHSQEPLKENFSSFLAEKLHHQYAYLSRLFSAVEGITIEKYTARLKIEKVKELLFYDELSLSEIAHKMNYSSVAYLSTQFKKETGMTPTEFKRTHQPGHQYLDSI